MRTPRSRAIQWVNHETGTILPVAAYARAVRSARRAAVRRRQPGARQAARLDVARSEPARWCVASGKIGGPAGAAALWVERCRELEPAACTVAPRSADGARARPTSLRSRASALRPRELPNVLAAMPRLAPLRDRLEQTCVRARGARQRRTPAQRVATVTQRQLAAAGAADMLVAALDLEGLCASSGAACSSGLGAPSPVLLAMYPAEPGAPSRRCASASARDHARGRGGSR